MTNCAYHLAQILESYMVPKGTTPESVRGFASTGDLDKWREVAESAALVRTVDYTLQGMDASGLNVEPFRDALGRWYAAIYFAATPWGSTANGQRVACADADLNLLRALGLTLEGFKPLHLTEDDRRALSDVLDEARTLIVEAGDELPADIKTYLWSLITRAYQVVSDLEKYGTEAVRQIALELGGAMVVQARRAQDQGDSERANRWGATAWNLMATCLPGIVTGTLGNVAAAPIIQQLTGGH